MDPTKVKDETFIRYGLEYKSEENRWITTLTTEEMECIDVCKKGNDKEDDTESVASLTDAEMDKLIRDASKKVMKSVDKPTKATKKKKKEKKKKEKNKKRKKKRGIPI